MLHGDPASETFLSEIVSAQPFPDRHLSMESLYEYGSRAGVWRVLRLFAERGLPLTVFGVARALQANPPLARALVDAGHEVAGHGLRWISYQDDRRRHRTRPPRRSRAHHHRAHRRATARLVHGPRLAEHQAARRRARRIPLRLRLATPTTSRTGSRSTARRISSSRTRSTPTTCASPRRRASTPATSSSPTAATPSTCSTPKGPRPEDALDRPARAHHRAAGPIRGSAAPARPHRRPGRRVGRAGASTSRGTGRRTFPPPVDRSSTRGPSNVRRAVRSAAAAAHGPGADQRRSPRAAGHVGPFDRPVRPGDDRRHERAMALYRAGLPHDQRRHVPRRRHRARRHRSRHWCR